MLSKKHLVLTLFCSTASIVLAQSNCQTIREELDIVSPQNIEHNSRMVVANCLGRAAINKCEGTCQSHVTPSVLVYPGLRKQCNCCREGRLQDLRVTLRRCYSEGVLLPNVTRSMVLRQPVECACRRCRN